MEHPRLQLLEFETLQALKQASNGRSPITIAACVSGGADSMALLHILKTLRSHRTATQFGGIRILALHCNHERRGEESDADEALVKNMCLEWNVPLHIERWSERNQSSDEDKENFQEAARNWRYQSAQNLLKRSLADAELGLIATAHHARDNAETILQNIIRGSGLEGLSGITEWSADRNLVRPLSQTHHADILAYIHQNGVPFREDSSNSTNDYTRNFIRNRILPLITEINPNYEDAFLRLSQNAAEALREIMIPDGSLPIHLGLSATQLLKKAHSTHAELPRLLTSQVLSNILDHVRKLALRKNPRPVVKIPLADGWEVNLGELGLSFERQKSSST